MRRRVGLPLMAAVLCLAMAAPVLAGETRTGAERVATEGGRYVPGTINYQGHLTDSLGNPITSTLTMTFRIFDSDMGGSLLWDEIRSVDVAEGIFNEVLGTMNPVPANIFVGGNPRWMEIEVLGEVLSPRTEIASVAYAFKAQYADDASYADEAGYADYAADAGHATNADNANYATNAGYATNANYATTSGHAQWSDSAAVAGNSHRLEGNNLATLDNRWVNEAGPDDMTSSSSTYTLSVTNSGTGCGIQIGTAGDNGLEVWRSDGNGVYVDSASSNGLYVRKSIDDALDIDYAYDMGIDIVSAGLHALSVGTTGDDGIHFYGTNNGSGLYLTNVKENGVHVAHVDSVGYDWNNAFYAEQVDGWGFGLLIDTTDINNAIFVQNAGYHGLSVGEASVDGVYVGTAGNYGYFVNDAGSHGVDVEHADYDGYYLYDSDRHGFHAYSPDSDAFHVDYAGGDGLHVENSEGYGVYLGTINDYGILIDSATSAYDGIWIIDAGDDGYYVSFAGDDGYYANSVGGDGLYVGSAGGRGVDVVNATSYGVYGNSNSNSGGYFRNNTLSWYSAYVMNAQGTGATIPGLYIQGRGYATGGWTTVLANGQVGHAIVSEEVEVISSGTAKLVNGQVVVDFDETFSSAISEEIPVNVTLTPVGMPAGMLYLDEVDGNGFTAKLAEIPGLERGVRDVSFNWMAIGRKVGYEETPDIEAPDETAIMAMDREQQHQAEAEYAIESEQQMGTRPSKSTPQVQEPANAPASNPAAPVRTSRVVPPEPVRTIGDPNDSNGR